MLLDRVLHLTSAISLRAAAIRRGEVVSNA
jgi:hypothetical protein